MTDEVLETLRNGWIPLGSARLRLGSTIRDAEEALGLDPEKPAHQWREQDGAEGCRWSVGCGLLWSPPPPGGVELVFLDDALRRVSGADASWETSGTSWSSVDPAMEIRNYRKARRELEGRLGKPAHAREEGEQLLVSSWVIGGLELTLCWEMKTPSLSLALTAPRS